MAEAVVVPLKRFGVAKGRLRKAPNLDAAAIAEELARGVIASSAPRHVIVLSEDRGVTAFALSLGAEVRESGAMSLNEAVAGAYQELRHRFNRLIIAHGDLAQPAGLGTFEPGAGITLFADRHGMGTNVTVLPTGLDFRFGFGPGSLRRHVAEAERLKVEFRVIVDSPWRFDVDEPGDLEAR